MAKNNGTAMATRHNGVHESFEQPHVGRRGRVSLEEMEIPALPAKAAGKSGQKSETVEIKAPNLVTIAMTIEGTSAYVHNRFSKKAIDEMVATQKAGGTAKGKKKRDPKDFQKCYEGATHKSAAGWCGIPASAFRSAMISACRTIGYKMTHAKLAVFCEADGIDAVDATPLVRITKGKPSMHVGPVRNDNGSIDIRARPMWEPGWRAEVRLTYDADMMSRQDVVNLFSRVGLQVGIGEGRNDSRNSGGCGWGAFKIIGESK